MARRTTLDDLTFVCCECRPTEALPDGTFPMYFFTPRAAALAVKEFVERETTYWSVHLDGLPAGVDHHVVSVVLDGMRYGPGGPDPA